MSNDLKGLQYLVMPLDEIAIDTLASETALIINSDYGPNMTRSFLAKKAHMHYSMKVPDVGDYLLCGLANGDLSVAELRLALITFGYGVDPNDPTNYANQPFVENIWWETVQLIGDSLGDGSGYLVVNEKISLGGGKGLPMKRNSGVQFFVWNPAGSAFVAGATILGTIMLNGVWLNDS